MLFICLHILTVVYDDDNRKQNGGDKVKPAIFLLLLFIKNLTARGGVSLRLSSCGEENLLLRVVVSSSQDKRKE